MWQEGVRPLVVVELLSPSTRNEDLGNTEQQPNSPPTKWQVYEHILGVPYYILFDRYTDQLRAFQLAGNQYRRISSEQSRRVWIPQLKLGLGLWSGEYRGIPRLWLRWYDEQGEWVLTEAEQERQRAEQSEQRVEIERQRTEQTQQQLKIERQRTEQTQQQLEIERQRAESSQQQLEIERRPTEELIARLRERGIDPDSL